MLTILKIYFKDGKIYKYKQCYYYNDMGLIIVVNSNGNTIDKIEQCLIRKIKEVRYYE